MYINSQEICEYFDSFGLPPSNPNFVSFMQRNSKIWHYNNVGLQSYYTDVCGKYCLTYLYYKCQNYSLQDFVGNFTSNKLHNDEKVTKMHEALFTCKEKRGFQKWDSVTLSPTTFQTCYPNKGGK